MLVLSRKKNETIIIQTDPPITITLCDIDRGKVMIGIKADKHISIYRGEVYHHYHPEAVEGESCKDSSPSPKTKIESPCP